ncbi:hypothetical protein AAIH74_38150, partial [Pseudomonas aeruginosa]|uniref:hypothetical protein n=1 Tax=Pseudomonas aeruginosa TaxID=287 RepID=UPI0031B6D916
SGQADSAGSWDEGHYRSGKLDSECSGIQFPIEIVRSRKQLFHHRCKKSTGRRRICCTLANSPTAAEAGKIDINPRAY